MIIGIMQPYFFPYFGYFDHIFRCDKWVVFDLSQYTHKSWMTRNRILHPETGCMYINCDVHGSQNMAISKVRLKDMKATRKCLQGRLSHYRKHAPYYRRVVELVEEAFDNVETDTLTAVNVSALRAICRCLNIPFFPVVASEEDYPLPRISHPGQWALEIADLLGADTYLNTPGGKELFKPEEFAERGIELAFTRRPEFTYKCERYKFEPNLSILDVLMWNSPEKVRMHLGEGDVDIASPV